MSLLKPLFLRYFVTHSNRFHVFFERQNVSTIDCIVATEVISNKWNGMSQSQEKILLDNTREQAPSISVKYLKFLKHMNIGFVVFSQKLTFHSVRTFCDAL